MKIITHLYFIMAWTGASVAACSADSELYPRVLYRLDRSAERSCFQIWAPYSPEVDIRSDVAIAYGVSDNLTSRIAEWKRQGYIPHLMTGAAWGQYEDYIDGRFDGKNHADEGQVDPQGQVIWHHPGVPYMVPTPSYVSYLCSLARKAIDAGAEALHFEEPEFWARAGYSKGFQSLWKAEYGEQWQRPDSSPDAFWRSSKLKYLLYKRTLEQVFADAKQYARKQGREIRCFVPTHSLVSYSQWRIVSPESSLMDLENCDGYIAQVWTGTARTPNVYRGVSRERTFEGAFLEYASMHSMTAPTGRTVYFLADPVEDDPNHTWDDYRANYQRVVAASLLFPDVVHFEVMPWPDRVMTAKYPAGSYAPDPKTTAVTIPSSYASELMAVVNALQEIGQEPRVAEWDCGSTDVAVLASDTMMFQRGNPWENDGEFSNYFGLAMPLVKAGLPAKCVILERVLDSHAFLGIGVLLASYEGMKPLKPEYNTALAEWVKKGGVLVYFGDDSDAFHTVREWWNEEGTTSGSARADLFQRLGHPRELKPGLYPTGKGLLAYSQSTPTQLAQSRDGADRVLQLLEEALRQQDRPLKMADHLLLRRGNYVAGAVLDETTSSAPMQLDGLYTDLFTSGLPVVKNPSFSPGEVFLLRTLAPTDRWQLEASNLRLELVEELEPGKLRLTFRGPVSVVEGLCRLQLPAKPVGATLENGSEVPVEWDMDSRTALLRFPNPAGGVRLLLRTGKTLPKS